MISQEAGKTFILGVGKPDNVPTQPQTPEEQQGSKRHGGRALQEDGREASVKEAQCEDEAAGA